MRCHTLVLLLWVTSASVRCDGKTEVAMKSLPNGVLVKCPTGQVFKGSNKSELTLEYRDEKSGEYDCGTESEGPKVFVKFRTCDNCVELDVVSLAGIVVGNLVATVAIGVAVYLTVSRGQTSLSSAHKKSSDRQHLVPSEARSRTPNDHYQPLNHKGAQKDMYDVLNSRR
ncbi:unnamed protein product [Tetraodon nigroviridis]|uniref:(spotted green pufferfish) hypothetical protein n=1 Tax=Tetraodon nigroviridis TaxID=99883 RepID=Q4SUX4_TETNG|nr:unnamed protein product [Tetraodon nigroviridis]